MAFDAFYIFSMIKNFPIKSGYMYREATVDQAALPTREKTMVLVNLYNLCHFFHLEVPDGGDGGDGGHVYFRSTGRLSSLYDLRRAHFFGNNGTNGLVSNRKR